MNEFKVRVLIAEGSRYDSEGVRELIKNTEQIFRKNGYRISLPVMEVIHIKKHCDSGRSILDTVVRGDIDKMLMNKENPNVVCVESGRKLPLFQSEEDEFNLIFVKSIYDCTRDSTPEGLTFEGSNTIFIREDSYSTTLAHCIINNFGVPSQFSHSDYLSYACGCLRNDIYISEDEKLVLSGYLEEQMSYL